METLPLFDEPTESPRVVLAERLRRLATEGIWIGTSSWKYPGWIGQVYTEQRYFVRGRFSQKKFEAECLAEYAETFPVVCGDFSFYQFPEQAYWKKLFDSARAPLRFVFKVPEEITCRRFPGHARYGPRAGCTNESFLSAALFQDALLARLEPYRPQVAVLIFEFGTSPVPIGEFVEELDRFLAAIPRDWRYSVEVRNRDYLQPAYFDCLRAHGAAHVFNSWWRMPDLAAQTSIPDAYTANFTVMRALLKPGRSYEQAVAKFSPYREIQEPAPSARDAMRKLIGRARKEREEAFIFVNNRLEGNAPGTIEAITD